MQMWSSSASKTARNAAHVLGQETNLFAIITRRWVGPLRLAQRSTSLPVRASLPHLFGIVRCIARPL